MLSTRQTLYVPEPFVVMEILSVIGQTGFTSSWYC